MEQPEASTSIATGINDQDPQHHEALGLSAISSETGDELESTAIPHQLLHIPLSINDGEDSYLSSPALTNSAEEEHLPRQVIAEEVGSIRLLAQLVRPLKLGTYNDLPACLLQFKLSFQRDPTRTSARIRSVHVKIVFEDAVVGNSSSRKKRLTKAKNHTEPQHPMIVAWHPKTFEGKISTARIRNQVGGGFEAGYMGVGASIRVGQIEEHTAVSRVTVNGLPGGGKHQNAIIWTMEEDSIKETGIPFEALFPLIITHKSNRFCAKVTVKADIGFWRGAFGFNVPVLGQNDEPLFFDPAILISKAEGRVAGDRDGVLIAEKVGRLNDVDLEGLSLFPAEDK